MGPTSYIFARKEVCPGKKKIRPPDCWDSPATSSQASKCLIVGTHLVEAYVALSFWSRTCTYILVVVEARTYTYVHRRGCKKENTATYIHTGRVSNAYSRIRTTRARVHGWVGTDCVVVFIGRAWTEHAMETRPGVPQNRGNGPLTFGTGSC